MKGGDEELFVDCAERLITITIIIIKKDEIIYRGAIPKRLLSPLKMKIRTHWQTLAHANSQWSTQEGTV